MEIDEDAPLALSFRDFKRNRSSSRNKNQPQAPPEEPAPLSPDLHPSQLPPADEQSTAKAPPKILVAEFDYSVENHFKAIDKIAKLCGYAETLDCNEAEIKRLSDSIIFLRHWRDFNYKPRIVRFACQRNSEEKEVMGEVTLPQFSAAAVPENEIRNASEVGVEHIKDFVMHVGGSVWALNWCPRVDRNPDNCIKSEEQIDPRFIKLQPVFRCSMLKCGDMHSIPLTVEWSVSSPHDMILAGCHDGVVAQWNFSVSDSSTEYRPLVYISADTSPIRTLAWAPTKSNESANIIITAGSKGFKFWDIRDPFRPLWVHPFQGITYCMDWLPDPRCVFGSMEDGTLWLLSLERAAHDIPLTGKCHNVSSKHGFHSFDCSSFAIWSLQALRLTGRVAYCGEEGSTFCFQLTARSLNDPSRNRVPHYLCGSILEEEPAVVIGSPLPSSSFQTKSPDMKRTRVKELEKRTKEQSIRRLTAAGQETSSFSSENTRVESRRGERGEEREPLPPKIVTMQRVRWNVNKGGEKWLCYGGAAGLVRCQEPDFSSF